MDSLRILHNQLFQFLVHELSLREELPPLVLGPIRIVEAFNDPAIGLLTNPLEVRPEQICSSRSEDATM